MRPVSDTKWIQCQTPGGDLMVFAGRPELRDRHKSVVVLIHDVLSTPGSMAPWFARLEPEAEVMLATLHACREAGKAFPVACHACHEARKA